MPAAATPPVETKTGSDPIASPPPDNAILGEAFSGLDAISGPDGPEPSPEPEAAPAPAPEPEPAAKPTAAPPKPAKPAKAEAKPAPAKPEAKPDAKPEAKPETQPDDKTPIEQMSPKDLRAAYTKLKAQIKDLEAKQAELAAKPQTPADDPEKKQLAEKLAEREKRLAEVEKERDFVDYEKGAEYKEKYFEPFVSAFAAGRAKAASVTVNGEDGEPRPGTADDFDRLMKITDENQAADLAVELFGNKAAAILFHRERVIEANAKRVKGLEDYKKTYEERTKQMQETRTAQAKAAHEQFQTHIKTATEKYPQWFKPTEGDSLDPKANELLENGMALADKAFLDSSVPIEELPALHAAIRNKAGAFDRVAYQLSQAQKRVKELETELSEFRNSTPGGGRQRKSGSAQPAGGETDWESRLDALASPE